MNPSCRFSPFPPGVVDLIPEFILNFLTGCWGTHVTGALLRYMFRVSAEDRW